MPTHRIGTREEWLAARLELLEEEKDLTRRNDELTRKRLELPWVPVEKEYRFETDEGTKTLAELFDGRSQLLVYHFMFGPQYAAGCPSCSSAADCFDGAIPHLNARDVTMVCVSRAPLERLQAYKRRMGWRFPWASSHGSDFNYDFCVSFSEEQMRSEGQYNYRTFPLKVVVESIPATAELAKIAARTGTDVAGYLREAPGLSAFALVDDVVHHTYTTYARGGEFLMGYYGLLDRAPKGRDEGSPPVAWLRRKDEYDAAPVPARATEVGTRAG